MRSGDSAEPSPLSPDNSVTKVFGPPPYGYSPPFHPQPPSVPIANPNAPVSLVWFRGHDLRVHDHGALDAAVASRASIVALYILECGQEVEGANRYNRPLRSSSQSSSSCSDVISTVTSDSSSLSTSTSAIPITEPKSPRIPLESERGPYGPLAPNGGFALGRVQRWYLHHSLTALHQQLQKLGITLVLRRVDCANDAVSVVTSVATALGASTVFWNTRYKPYACPVDETVKSALRKRGIHAQDFDSETLMPPSMTICGRYNDFQSYTRFWVDAIRACPPPRPNNPITKIHVAPMERSRVHHLLAQGDHHAASLISFPNCPQTPLPSVTNIGLLNGLSLEGLDDPGNADSVGCVAAHRAIESFLQQDRFARFSRGPVRRDGMVTGDHLATSRLSPHIRFGEISLRVLFYKVVDAGAAAHDAGNEQGLEAARTYVKNLSLREFGYYMLSRYPTAAYKPIMPEFEAFPWVEDEDGALTRAWETGTTGFPIVDAAMRQLLREGWLHNRMRFLAASFFCKYLLLPWPVGAAHLVRTLVDGDEACNSLGWQWTVGCNSDSFPFSTLVNPLSLYTHTQSRKRAAEYVRKYVPELAHLPDRLVFSPWKATEEERALYHLTIIPLGKYNKQCQDLRYCPGISGQFIYPARVVTGKDARFRARRAMEIMRRIFAAQRQCRTIIAEQQLPRTGILDRKHPLLADDEVSKKKLRTVEGVQVADSDGTPVLELDVSELDSTVSCVSDAASSTKPVGRRRRESGDAELHAASRKRRRRITPSTKQKIDPLRASSQTPRISGRPMMSIAQLSSPPIDPKPQGVHDVRQSSDRDAVAGTMRGRRASQREPTKNTTVAGSVKNTSPRNMKRPRPVSPNIGQTSSERLSVRALLSPSLTHDPGMVAHSSPLLLQSAQGGSPMVSSSRVNPLPKLAQVALCQNQTSGNGAVPNDPATPDLLTYYPPRLNRNSSALSPDTRPPVTPNPQTPQVRSSHSVHRKTLAHPNTNGGLATPQSRIASSPTSPFRYSSPTHDNAGVGLNTRRVCEGDGRMIGSTANTRVRGPQAQVTREMAGPSPSFEMHRAQAPAVFHTGVSPVPLISGQYQHSQHHNPQMMVSFRPPPNNTMQVPHLNHAGGPMQSPSASQGYFAANPIGANQHQAAGQQVLWYPTPLPYVELRGHGLPGTIMPHMMHPMTRQHPHGMPIGYPIPGTNAMGAQGDPSRMITQAGISVPFAESDGSARRGPNSPLEREAIARRMAAMDYHDENYGGKHWEQWQAISLHLLNQYEFSEDTDRDTSRAYVRLCVLKDELRIANPNGPRVTVNHCKEVFRILNLPVTGEWDRRGHGGVRGPYVYGCVKKSGVQVSRR